jgi:hypothetical protein
MTSHLGRRLTSPWGGTLVLLATLRLGAVHATPLPPGAKASRPCDGPPATDLPLSRSVDAFSDAVYDLDWGSEQGRLSQWLTLRYADGLTLYVVLPGYVRELATKYRPGDRIANVPSSGALAGKRLVGRQYLEIPIQLRPIPNAVLDLAKQLKIIIRDVTGRIYE